MLENFEISSLTVFYLSLILAAVLVAEIGFMLFTKNDNGKSRINRRMKVSNEDTTQREILIKLRKERGMDEDGGLMLPITAINQLIVQSGLKIGLPKFFLFYAIYLLGISIVVLYLSANPITMLVSLPVTGFLIPMLWLKKKRAKKLIKFGEQLPEAIELVTRSLKAGHPVPVALNMVAREMPDPIGTEFGMVVDEVTYGSDLVTGLLGLYDRVGHPDLPLLVSAVSIQSTTGGNLREILESLSTVIRDRLKMKAKVRAISSEGRMSATFLSGLPFALIAVLYFIMPGYYSGIWEGDLAYKISGGLAFWLVAGNVLIMKMISFKV